LIINAISFLFVKEAKGGSPLQEHQQNLPRGTQYDNPLPFVCWVDSAGT